MDKITAVYNDYAIAFKDVAAFIVTNQEGISVANVAFKRCRWGNVECYFHFFGAMKIKSRVKTKMTRLCPAVVEAVRQLDPELSIKHKANLIRIKTALEKESYFGWDVSLREAGFKVYRAV